MNTNVEHGTPNQAVAPTMSDKDSMMARAIPRFVSKSMPCESKFQSNQPTRRPSRLQAAIKLPVPQNISTNCSTRTA
jgi:hypothetical protein